VVEYDDTAPCRMCGQPIIEASMGGTDVCPWCDCGYNRDGSKWSAADFRRIMKRANATHMTIEQGRGVPP
jgi:hypothetical protein